MVTHLSEEDRVTFYRMDARLEPEPASALPEVPEDDLDDLQDMEVVDEVGYEESVSASESPSHIPQPSDHPPRSPVRSSARSVKTCVLASPSRDAIDAHFHLDRLSHKMTGTRSLLSLRGLGTTLSKEEPTLPINLVGGIGVFCDPTTYPEQFPLQSGFKFAVGFHPRHVPQMTPHVRDRLETLMLTPGVAALGEIGLDHTEPECRWTIQEEVYGAVEVFHAYQTIGAPRS